MGLFTHSRNIGGLKHRTRTGRHRCRVEVLEPRLLLAGDVDLRSQTAFDLADVNDDSVLSPKDPLAVINAIKKKDGEPAAHLDPTGDGVVNAADVDFIIRVFAARHSGNGERKQDAKYVDSYGATTSSSTLVAQDDSAYTYGTQAIDIDVLNNDYTLSLSIFAISSATDGTRGTTQIVDGRIRYTPTGTLLGPDSFEYTITSTDGESDTAIVSIDVVKMIDYTVERQKLDGTWVAVPDGELSWAHDTLRWTPVFQATHGLTQGTTWWTAVDRADPTVGVGFASATHPSLATGNPGAGLWNVNGSTEFTSPNQSMFFAKMDAPKAKDVAEITEVVWMGHEATPGDAGILAYTDPDAAILYPDADAPGGAAKNKVDVIVRITPPLPNVTLQLRWYDVDDASDHDGPVDDDSAGVGDLNEPDNFLTGTGAAVVFASSSVTDQVGEIRETFEVGWIQPGNNFRVAAGPRQDEIQPVQPFEKEPYSRLFYDKNGNSTWDNLAGEPALMDFSNPTHGVAVSPVLTIWRYLHVEVDSMGKVYGNSTAVNVTAISSTADSSTLDLQDALPGVDNNRFQNGSFVDSNGNQWLVDSNTIGTVTVKRKDQDGDGTKDIPAIGPGTLTDDDEIKDSIDVPMPDTSALGDTLMEVYIAVKFDVGDDNNNATFALNANESDVLDPQYITKLLDWDTRDMNSATYWVAYVLGGYQPEVDWDFDQDGELPVKLGLTHSRGLGSIVFLETDRDLAKHQGWDRVKTAQDTVAHEIGHALASTNVEPVMEFEVDLKTYGSYTEEYRKLIRSAVQPLS